jgi:hypothetical protein
MTRLGRIMGSGDDPLMEEFLAIVALVLCVLAVGLLVMGDDKNVRENLPWELKCEFHIPPCGPWVGK